MDIHHLSTRSRPGVVESRSTSFPAPSPYIGRPFAAQPRPSRCRLTKAFNYPLAASFPRIHSQLSGTFRRQPKVTHRGYIHRQPHTAIRICKTSFHHHHRSISRISTRVTPCSHRSKCILCTFRNPTSVPPTISRSSIRIPQPDTTRLSPRQHLSLVATRIRESKHSQKVAGHSLDTATTLDIESRQQPYQLGIHSVHLWNFLGGHRFKVRKIRSSLLSTIREEFHPKLPKNL